MKVINKVDLRALHNLELRNFRNRHNKESLGVYFHVDYEVSEEGLFKILCVTCEEPCRLHHAAKINSCQQLGSYINFIKGCGDAHLGVAYLKCSCCIEEAEALNENSAGRVYSNSTEAYEEYCLALKDSDQIDKLVDLACGTYKIRIEYGMDYVTYDFGSVFVAINKNV